MPEVALASGMPPIPRASRSLGDHSGTPLDAGGAGVQPDEFFLIGNAFLAIAVTGMFGMGHTTAGERRSQTLATLLASPANRFAVFLGRALPSIVTGFFVAATSFAICAAILGEHIPAPRFPGLALATLASAFSCTALGLCLGVLGLRGRNVSIFADVIAACLLVVSGANVPLHRLPGGFKRSVPASR